MDKDEWVEQETRKLFMYFCIFISLIASMVALISNRDLFVESFLKLWGVY